jgi:hypothetical protein
MRFMVTVTRTSFATREIYVDAEDVVRARRQALEEAGGFVFHEHDADYEVDDVAPLLKAGDRVFWNDPDGGSCSRELVVKHAEMKSDFVRIEDEDGSVVECPVEELSFKGRNRD